MRSRHRDSLFLHTRQLPLPTFLLEAPRELLCCRGCFTGEGGEGKGNIDPSQGSPGLSGCMTGPVQPPFTLLQPQPVLKQGHTLSLGFPNDPYLEQVPITSAVCDFLHFCLVGGSWCSRQQKNDGQAEQSRQQEHCKNRTIARNLGIIASIKMSRIENLAEQPAEAMDTVARRHHPKILRGPRLSVDGSCHSSAQAKLKACPLAC